MKTCSKCGATAANLVKNDFSTSCRKCGNLMYGDQFMSKQIERKNSKPTVCSGCKRNYISPNNKKGLCGQCRAEMNQWEANGRCGRVPLIKVLGIWVRNRP